MNKIVLLLILLNAISSTTIFAQQKRKPVVKKVITTHHKKPIYKNKKTPISKVHTIEPEKPVKVNLEALINPDKMAEYIGGQNKLYDYLNANLIYPELAQENEIQGTVYIQFKVCTDGKLCDLKIDKGVSKELNDEALRVVSKMGNWKPAMDRGKPVPSIYKLPIRFTLSE
jgi:protein TonB